MTEVCSVATPVGALRLTARGGGGMLGRMERG